MPDLVYISINGTLNADLTNDLLEVVVDTNLFLPGMFLIKLKDESDSNGSFKYADATTFTVGAEIEIKVTSDDVEGLAAKAPLFKGEVTGIEPVFASDGVPIYCIRGYDKLHRLARGKKSATYANVMDSDIARTVISGAGLSADVSVASEVTHPYVIQYNQSDLDFLWSRARLLGCQVYYANDKVCFKDAASERSTTDPAVLEWKLNLSRFEPRVNASGQIQKATARGWDYTKKQAIVGQSNSDTSLTVAQTGITQTGNSMSSTFGTAEEMLLGLPIGTETEATNAAKARYAQNASEFIQADGYCRVGDPRLSAGVQVEIKGIGTTFSGKYYVTEAHHTYDEAGFSTRFSVTGRSPNTLAYLLSKDDGPEPTGIRGVVPALVTNVKDDKTHGRIKVKFPWMPTSSAGAELESDWIRIATPMAGKSYGMYYLPEINDEVLVAFDQDNMGTAYMVGALFNGTDTPPTGTAEIIGGDGKINQRILRSRTGHLVILDDTQGAEQIIIKDKTANNFITIKSSDNSMEIKSAGDLTITAGGKLTMKSTGDMSMETQANGSIKTTQNLTMQASAQGSLKATSSLTVESSAATTVKGATVEVNGTGSAALKSANVEVNGTAMTAVKSAAMVQVQGALVKIN
jgi:uncharacterized protein involved in type VI secretion and phage assembly